MTPSPETLAQDFCQELRAFMTAAQVDEAARRNTAEPNPHVCHTHDFCCANMAMQAAFLRQGVDPAEEGAIELWGGLWNRAWELAASNLRIRCKSAEIGPRLSVRSSDGTCFGYLKRTIDVAQ